MNFISMPGIAPQGPQDPHALKSLALSTMFTVGNRPSRTKESSTLLELCGGLEVLAQPQVAIVKSGI